MSFTNLNKLLRDLKVISRIEENGRLSTTGRNTVSIESDSLLQGFWRSLWGDSRERGSESVANVVTAVIEISEALMESRYLRAETASAGMPEEYVRTEREKVIDALRKVSKELHSAVRGISNLSCTYKDDQVMAAKLEQLIGDAEAHVAKVDQCLAKLKEAPQETTATTSHRPKRFTE